MSGVRERFVGHARLVRARPRFDEGHRDWKFEKAAEVREMLRAEHEPDEWLPAVQAVFPGHLSFRDHRYDLPTARQVTWLWRWARLDPASLAGALRRFADTDGDPVERVAAFVGSAQGLPAETRVWEGGLLAISSFLNFSLDPESLPIMRAATFHHLEQILGHDQRPAAPLVERYENNLSFAREIETLLKDEGVDVRDMVDVQSLIFICAHESDFWVGEEPRRAQADRGRARFASEGKPYLSICAIYRDEAEYLQEWIEFHRLVGVERFFLYDNQSTDNALEVLTPYVENGIVVHHDWPLFPGQFEAYNHCLTEHRGDARWIALQDVDEFLFSPTGAMVSDVLVDFEQYPAVGVSQMMFGTSGHRTAPPGLVIEEHTRRDALAWPFIKNVVDPTRVKRCINAHVCTYDSRTIVDENHEPIIHKMGRTQFPSASRLRINHYYFKSQQEGRAKLARPMAIGGTRPYDFDTLDRELNAESDDTITRYVPALREALAVPARKGRLALRISP